MTSLVAAPVVLATTPIGAKASAGVHLARVVTILAAMLALDSRTGAGPQADAR